MQTEISSALRQRAVQLSERAASFMVVGIVAWAQFPLGSNRPWSWSLLVLLIALSWLTWIPLAIESRQIHIHFVRRLAIPGVLMACAVFWAVIQCLTIVPETWKHPIWRMAELAIGQHTYGTISVNPFETITEVMKLSSYMALGWITLILSVRHQNARLLLVTVFVVGVAYSLEGFLLIALHSSQQMLLEGVASAYARNVTGAFVNRNSFATFTGLAALVGFALCADKARGQIVTDRGWRRFLTTVIRFISGRGAVWLVGTFILLSALIGSSSRGGFISTIFGLLAMFALALAAFSRTPAFKWTLISGSVAGLLVMTFFWINGTSLQSRFEYTLEPSAARDLRPVMWDVAARAIRDRPVLGSGLGTYRDVFPLYATNFVPYIVDRAHNDYLELALGLGIPAACCWLIGILLLLTVCINGTLRRQRRRIYSMVAVGGTVLVGVHSMFDFSLQMPAVSILYSVLLGVGLAQSESTQVRQSVGVSRSGGRTVADA